MVTYLGWIIAQARTPVWLELSRGQRLRVLAAIGLVLALGGLLILFAWWGARFTRRYMRRSPRHEASSSVSRFLKDGVAEPPAEDDPAAPAH